MISLRFIVPLPPSINSQYLTVGRRRVLSKTAKAFKADVKKIVERHRSAGELTVQDELALRGQPETTGPKQLSQGRIEHNVNRSSTPVRAAGRACEPSHSAGLSIAHAGDTLPA